MQVMNYAHCRPTGILTNYTNILRNSLLCTREYRIIDTLINIHDVCGGKVRSYMRTVTRLWLWLIYYQ